MYWRYKARQFMGIIADAEVLDKFDVEVYFAFVEKMTVRDGGRVIVSLLDGTEVECEGIRIDTEPAEVALMRPWSVFFWPRQKDPPSFAVHWQKNVLPLL